MKKYLMNCRTQDERWRIVNLILGIVERSDYIRVLYELPEDNVRIILHQKYEVIKEIIRTLADDTDDSEDI